MNAEDEAAEGRSVPASPSLPSLARVKGELYATSIVKIVLYSLIAGFMSNWYFEGLETAWRNKFTLMSGYDGMWVALLVFLLRKFAVPIGVWAFTFLRNRPRFVRFAVMAVVMPILCGYFLKAAIVGTQLFRGQRGDLSQPFSRELAMETFLTPQSSFRMISFIEVLYQHDNVSPGLVPDHLHWQFGLRLYVFMWMLSPIYYLLRWAWGKYQADIDRRAHDELIRRIAAPARPVAKRR